MTYHPARLMGVADLQNAVSAAHSLHLIITPSPLYHYRTSSQTLSSQTNTQYLMKKSKENEKLLNRVNVDMDNFAFLIITFFSI